MEVAEEVGLDVADHGTEGSKRADVRNIFKIGPPSHPHVWLGDTGGEPLSRGWRDSTTGYLFR